MAPLCALAMLLLLLLCPPVQPKNMVGSYHKADVNSADVRRMAAFATQAYNKQSNSLTLWGLYKLEDAWTQVVAGVNYCLNVMLHSTVCRKNRTPTDQWQACKLAAGGNLVVAGVNYCLNVMLHSTVCRKNRTPTDQWQACKLAAGGNLGMNCMFKIYDVPWENTTTMTSSNCTSTRTLDE